MYTGSVKYWWARLDLNQRPIGYARHYNFRCLFRVWWSGLSLRPRKYGCLPFSLYTFPDGSQDLARDYHTYVSLGFPEFDKIYLLVTQ